MTNESFEEKIANAKSIMEKLMKQDISLEDSVKLYEDGIKNIQEASTILENAKAKIKIIEQSSIKDDA
ncbi:Exodeoxyribonuclease VII, small subunit [Sulfurovum sp. enrichment culture clone C5]|uniref:Exodeoxyribonuclease 7 small subunit n=1 Tax=Sulfurovum sp. enrichment culture clone C5 TaxID=497650 RepID=A0A0S4XLL6_9BACT|nr:Exodeoxyribonuclease VII, small subunit [Sulfurovum sp. enrichment culture clone C5]